MKHGQKFNCRLDSQWNNFLYVRFRSSSSSVKQKMFFQRVNAQWHQLKMTIQHWMTIYLVYYLGNLDRLLPKYTHTNLPVLLQQATANSNLCSLRLQQRPMSATINVNNKLRYLFNGIINAISRHEVIHKHLLKSFQAFRVVVIYNNKPKFILRRLLSDKL